MVQSSKLLGDYYAYPCSVREMKDTAKFGKLVEESNEPVIVTRNGRDAYVVMTSDAYDAVRQDLARMKLYEIVDRAEAELAAGEYVEGTAFLQELRTRYGL
ncbi:type II toxin-antitoxin system prevent-host-death family antitoxin [Enorma sp.]|uniref:type II toxin-antitoxin system prevent-host-death family antitoxin n=1 Tax=Enorma sp. TaxID=1920692 RepID=UPI0025C66439|nr:type II toxin-antitoxin system prevent-host-death family antitoxin [Enorma sp.]